MNIKSSPTVQTLTVILTVFVAQTVGTAVSSLSNEAFTLTLPLSVQPWSLIVSTYAHAGVLHLFGNLIFLVIFGVAVERITTPLRFHAFFIITGMVGGVAEIAIRGMFLGPTSVIGASGAIFGLAGYVLTANTASSFIFDFISISKTYTAAILLSTAVLLTIIFSGAESAIFAHLVGLLIGLAAGRGRLLNTE